MDLTYDQGTLLLRGSAAAVKRLKMAEIVWDPRVGAWRAPAYRYVALTAQARATGVRLSDGVRIPDDRVVLSAPDLRRYQADALLAWEMHGRQGSVALPTGAGKTIVAVHALARAGCTALVLVPTRVLLEQWRAVLARAGLSSIGLIGDGEHELQPVTVCTFESAFRHLDRFGDRFRLLIVDEVHHFGSGVRAEALEMSVAPWRLGLSATLPESPDAAGRLVELVGPTVFELRVGDLTGTSLAPLDRVLLPVSLAPEERDRYLASYAPFARARRAFAEVHPGAGYRELVAELSRTEAGRAALAGWREARAVLAFPQAKQRLLRVLLQSNAGKRILVFTADNATAYRISELLLVPAVTSDIGRAERSALLERFRSGEVPVLVSARVLNEGIDVPGAEVAIVVGGALGSAEHAQRAGRILRPSPGKRATLYELVVRDSMEERQSERRQTRLAARGAASLQGL
jgi:superfamily II DNA or RNA helicase